MRNFPQMDGEHESEMELADSRLMAMKPTASTWVVSEIVSGFFPDGADNPVGVDEVSASSLVL